MDDLPFNDGHRSFVSSFMGMNTTDIRDTPHDQKIFWTAAIPVTVGVVALSFIYGYKGDAIEDFVTTAFWSMVPGQRRRQRRFEEIERQSAPEVLKQVSFKDDGRKGKSSKYLPSWMRYKRRQKKGNINHRATDDTFFTV